MEKILLTLADQAEKTGKLKASTLQRMLAYNNRHSMWVVGASQAHLNAFKAMAAHAARHGIA